MIFVLFILFSVWSALQFLAPFALPKNSVPDLSGVVGVSDNDYLIKNMSFPWNVLYSSGDRLCHQQASRSLYFNGNQMPFCTRCTAIWLGIAIGLGFIMLVTLELTGGFLVALILCIVPLGIDGVGQLLGFWESTNIIRFITGFPAGIICGVAIGIIIDETKGLLADRRKKRTHPG
ncbi:MAG TPA: DUF2085 domain-containing protein [Candidatus Thermoplasmatota archaeon]|nr:DUF2085 domain-containing protein [Candidatus Thermoplasmatota archaeon]